MADVPEHLKLEPDLGFLTADELSERIGVSVSKLRRMRAEGGGPPFVKLGQHVRYPVRELLKWEQTHVQRHTSDRRGALLDEEVF